MNSPVGALLAPYQQRWVADPSPLKVYEKGRRTGITFAESADAVLIASADRSASGQNVYYIPQTKEDAIEFLEACERWASLFQYVVAEMEQGWYGDHDDPNDPDREVKTYSIKFHDSGFRIVGLSSAPSRIRGKQGVIVIDEAAFQPNLPGLLKASLALLLRGGRVRVISTHNGDQNPFNELIAQIRTGARKGSVHLTTFRQAVADGMYRRICQMEGWEWSEQAEAAYVADAYAYYGDDATEELDAIPSAGSGVFLSTTLIEARAIDCPVVTLERPDGYEKRPVDQRRRETLDWCDEHIGPILRSLDRNLDHVYGMDVARSGDLSVIAVAETDVHLHRNTRVQIELRNVPFADQRVIVFYVGHRLPRFRAAAHDARGIGADLAEAAADEFGPDRVAQVQLSAAWYRDHMPGFRVAFEDDRLRVPRHADTRKDLRSIRIIDGIAKVPDDAHHKGADGKPRHGDAAIALALMWYASLQDPVEIDYDVAATRDDYLTPGDDDDGHYYAAIGFGAVMGGEEDYL